jgi:mRNA interferase RelE/StbE
MLYKIVLKTEVNEELAELSNRERLLVFKQLKKIATSPELGQVLGNKAGLNLSSCRKMYADKKKIRIVYTILEDEIIIEVIAIGKRDELEVYKKASQRLE